ncbi:MAG TPA: MFS transporter [Steroidobacteraceae bacterium]|jgi:Arabinose efflux permease|nr:MFS transporter [Steroidobacteraceae bacterium]
MSSPALEQPAPAAISQEKAWVNPLYAWFVVLVLTLAYTCSFIDRQILTLLIEPIRRDLHITDTGVSLLGSLAFSIFYTTLGIPIARLADRAHRRNLMAAGLAFWSLMTAAGGLARGFWSLFAARVGVGVGEAALSPAAFSLLSDYFPPRRVALAVSVYSMGLYFGAGLALMIGASVVAAVSNAPMYELPLVGEVFPWQLTFFIVASLGLPVLLLMFLIREPMRRAHARKTSVIDAGASSWSALREFMGQNVRTLVCHISAFTLFGVGINCYLFWGPSMMIRTHGWDTPRAGHTIGAMLFFLGTAGVFCGGWVAGWLAAKGRRDAILRAAFFGMLCGIPFLLVTPLLPDARLATITLGVGVFFMAYPQGLPAAALQVITPNPLRAQMTAIYFFIGNLIASGLGPTIPALLNDYVFRDPAQLRYSLFIVEAAVLPVSMLFLYFGLKPYAASVERAE